MWRGGPFSWDDGKGRGRRGRVGEKGREEHGYLEREKRKSAGDLLAGSTMGAVRTEHVVLLQPWYDDML